MYSPHAVADLDCKDPLLPSLIKSKKAIDQIRHLLKEKKAKISNYGHEVYCCPKCGEFHGRFFIHLDYDGGSYEVPYRCGKCKVALKLVDYDLDNGWGEKRVDLAKYPCPQCGKHTFTEGGSMIMWD